MNSFPLQTDSHLIKGLCCLYAIKCNHITVNVSDGRHEQVMHTNCKPILIFIRFSNNIYVWTFYITFAM